MLCQICLLMHENAVNRMNWTVRAGSGVRMCPMLCPPGHNCGPSNFWPDFYVGGVAKKSSNMQEVLRLDFALLQ